MEELVLNMLVVLSVPAALFFVSALAFLVLRCWGVDPDPSDSQATRKD